MVLRRDMLLLLELWMWVVSTGGILLRRLLAWRWLRRWAGVVAICILGRTLRGTRLRLRLLAVMLLFLRSRGRRLLLRRRGSFGEATIAVVRGVEDRSKIHGKGLRSGCGRLGWPMGWRCS